MNPAYRAWIRTLPCVAAVALKTTATCVGAVQFCHLHHEKMGGGAAPDDVGNGFPACVQHHADYHRIWQRAFSQKYEDIPELCARLGREYTEGVEFPDEPWAAEFRTAA